MGIPKSNIVTGKYTSGGEFVILSTNAPYQGYYYEYNNNTYVGEEYNVNAPEIVRIDSDKYNKLYNSNKTAIYSATSGITSQTLSTPKIISLPYSGNDLYKITKFFCKKYNDNIIKEIDEQTYKSLQSQPIYQTTFIGTYQNRFQTLEGADKQIPGVKIFLLG